MIKTFVNTSFFSYILFFIPSVSQAQIIPDQTLPNQTQVNIQERNFTIEGGTQLRTNLFHSFQDFSIPNGSSLHFNNALDVQNIITRVTGQSVSSIDGLIKANGTANIILINPNGIIFGKNSSLQIGGSFLATTANSVKFADDIEFSATKPDNPILTINIPIGLQFNGNPGNIQVQGNGYPISISALRSPIDAANIAIGLQVPTGNTLALIGGKILLDGGVLSSKNGRIELASIEAGEVGFNSFNHNWFFTYDNLQNYQDIGFYKNALVYVNTQNNTNNTLNIIGKKVQILDGSLIMTQNQGLQTKRGISIHANLLELKGNSVFGFSGIYTSNFGHSNGEDININADEIQIQGTQIATTSFTDYSGGNIIINANKYLEVTGSTPSSFNRFGYGGINTFTYLNYGNSGNILINTNNLNLSNRGNITTVSSSFGNAGNLEVTAANINIINGASLGSSTFNFGKGGNVLVNATDSIFMIGRSPIVGASTINVATFGTGNAGNLEVNTSKLFIRDGAGISTSSFAFGSSGNLVINSSNIIELSGVFDIDSPSFINSSVIGLTDELRARFDRVPLKPIANAGTITINTGTINILNGAQVGVQNNGFGNAGTLQFNAESINLDNRANIDATTKSGEGGNIQINTQQLKLRNNSSITATSEGTSNGGNITINTNILIGSNSNITANAFEGRGGNIRINTQGLFLSPNSKITASSQRGINGTVQFNISQKYINPNSVQSESVSVTPEVVSVCQGRSTSESQFMITGSGGLQPSPDNLPDMGYMWQRHPVEQEQVTKIQSQESTIIVEAQGLVKNPDGSITLTAEPNIPNITTSKLPSPNSCSPETTINQASKINEHK